VAAIVWGAGAPPARASPAGLIAAATTEDLTRLSLEQLMDLEVTSVAKKPQKFSEAAAAIYVITQEDIRRSGATTIPELLRMAPGVDVAQVNSSVWAVSARGMNGRFANKLLVLIDGRSVYTPIFGGVTWDIQSVPLGDIDRIEVIRGPGGALWGANAVNGVINIITKNASETQGVLASATAGSIDQPSVAIRYGGRLSASSYLRVYGQGFQRRGFRIPTDNRIRDGWDGGMAGFRFDSTPSAADVVMLQGELYEQEADSSNRQVSLAPPLTSWANMAVRSTGGHALLRWSRSLGQGADATLQLYYDRVDRTRKAAFDDSTETYDLDFQHRFRLAPGQEVVWGVGYRRVNISFRTAPPLSLGAPVPPTDLYSAFVQDEIALRKDLRLTVGSKFEHNTYTGFEYQPSIRLVWEPGDDQTVWAAVSRAVRVPTPDEREFVITAAAVPGPLPGVITIFNNPDFVSEDVVAYEAGYRKSFTHRVNLDVAAYVNHYSKLAAWNAQTPFPAFTPPPPHLVIPLRVENLMHGDTYGVEVAANWQVTPNWRLTSSYTWSRARMRLGSPSADPTFLAQTEGGSPEHQFQLRSQLDLPHNLELDGALYYVGALPALKVDAYTRVDVRLGWRPSRDKDLEISLVGQNLLDRRHQEFAGEIDVLPALIPRSIHVQATVGF
jgi:iron complex outermembrane receptor protein